MKVSEVPEHTSVHYELLRRYKMENYLNIKPIYSKSFNEFSLTEIDFRKMKAEIEKAFEDFGWYGFTNIYSMNWERSLVYGGLGITYNPNYQYSKVPIHAQVFGAPRYNLPSTLLTDDRGIDLYRCLMNEKRDKEFFYSILPKGFNCIKNWLKENNFLDLSEQEAKELFSGIEEQNLKPVIRNSYSDSYGFIKRSSVANKGELSKLLNRIKVPIIRSRIAEINHKQIVRVNPKLFWHRDENPIFEFRLVFSIKTEPGCYGMCFEDGSEIVFEESKGYFWDTGSTHSPTIINVPNKSRINVVVGVAPWFDYNSIEQEWVPNQFFGKKHPFDMFLDGDIILL